MLLIEFFTEEYKPRRLLGKSGHSERLYRLSIAAFSKSLGRPAKLVDLTNKNLVMHMQNRLDGKMFAGKSRGTANKDRCQILAIWRMAHRLGFVDVWPEVPELPEPERVPKAWTREDLEKLFGHIDQLDGMLNKIPAKLWWRAMVMLALDTAERIGAVRAARWDWLEDRWIQIPAEVRKGGKRDKKYWLSPTTFSLLSMVRKHDAQSELILPWPYCENSIWIEYGKILKAAGLPHGRQDKFHRLRKTTASVLFAAGCNPQEALDHQHRRTTRRYIDPRFTRDIQPSDYLAKFLSEPKKDLPPHRKSG